ncbi:MAG TPA: P-loop NTPase fold protein, partial [Pyrinomonadaceae bacterium]
IGMDREKVAAGLAVKNEKLLPYLAQRPAGQAAKDRARAADAADPAPAKPAAQPSHDIAFGLEYGYNFIEKFIQIPFRVPQPAQMGVRTLLDFIAPLVEGAEDGAPRKREGATLDASPARGTPHAAQVERDPAEILREAGASVEIIDADKQEPAAKGPEEKESLMLLERGDSLTVRNIVLMVAPALDYNPRRIKQFINLFRLKVYIAFETGLFRRPRAGSPFDALTFQQLGKFVAIGLRWPRLLADLDEDYGLLQRLQEVANGGYPLAGDQAVHHWQQRGELMNLLRFGCVGVEDLFDQDRLSDMGRYSLDRLDVGKLLRVSPPVERALPPARLKARPADTEPSPGLVESAEQDEAAFS